MENGRINISSKMLEVNRFLIGKFEGMNHCISEKGANLLVEVPKRMLFDVVSALRPVFGDVVEISRAYRMIDFLHDFILVKPLITEAPLSDADGIPVPSLEKVLVDTASDKEFASLSDLEVQRLFQKAFEMGSLNKKKILRYAARKGEKEQIERRLSNLDEKRLHTVSLIRECLSSKPVDKAWVFGSFSRMEEREDSDIDILFSATDKNAFSLMDHVDIQLELEALLGKKVDLVTEGSLLPFAAASANKDKYLVYERIR